MSPIDIAVLIVAVLTMAIFIRSMFKKKKGGCHGCGGCEGCPYNNCSNCEKEKENGKEK